MDSIGHRHIVDETNDLGGEETPHAPVLGSVVLPMKVGDSQIGVAISFYITRGTHPTVLGNIFQTTCTCYRKHDEKGFTCFHSLKIPRYCRHGRPV